MNPDEISRRCANLSLSEEDGPVAKIDGDHHEKGVMNVSMSLIVQAVRPSQSAKQESEFVEKSETMRPMGGEELLIPEDAQAPSLSCGQEEKILVLVRL
ncbi:hypothetical protein ACOSQ2_012685 [Xanthoceras sorbifolium]